MLYAYFTDYKKVLAYIKHFNKVKGEIMTVQEILKQEFENVEISSDAWDMAKALNMFSRDIKAIVNDTTAERMAIMTGGKGKFVWIQYHDPNDPLGDGGVASGNIEDAPIHSNHPFYDKINYSKIAFALIPVDDF